jgi:ferritin
MSDAAIKPGVLKELQRQFNQELGAAHAYLALATWCHDQNLKGFARYFSKQAWEEREHAQKLMEHLLDRGVMPRLAAIAEPRCEFDGLAEIAQQARAMEIANTAGIHACHAAAVRDGDVAAQVLLQWFVTEQVEEENWADEMVKRVAGANCAGGVSDLDRHIERYLSEHGLNTNGGESK